MGVPFYAGTPFAKILFHQTKYFMKKSKTSLGRISRSNTHNIAITGHATTVVSKVKKLASTIILQNQRNFKVGKTSVDARGSNKAYKDFYDSMFFIYQTTSEESVSFMEEEIIKHCKSKFPNLCLNISDKSLSKTGKSTSKKVYLAFK